MLEDQWAELGPVGWLLTDDYHNHTILYEFGKIIYTEEDEAPMSTSFSLLLVMQRFAKPMDIK